MRGIFPFSFLLSHYSLASSIQSNYSVKVISGSPNNTQTKTLYGSYLASFTDSFIGGVLVQRMNVWVMQHPTPQKDKRRIKNNNNNKKLNNKELLHLFYYLFITRSDIMAAAQRFSHVNSVKFNNVIISAGVSKKILKVILTSSVGSDLYTISQDLTIKLSQ